MPPEGKGGEMTQLNSLKPVIKEYLEKHPVLRDDDWWLIGKVYKEQYGINYEMSFLEVMKRHKDLGLPSFETIRRTRQKVQEENPHLESSKAKKKERQIAFNDFYEFAKEGRTS